MIDLEELKQHVAVHAEGLRMKDYRQILDRICADGDGPGSWTGEWCAAGDRFEAQGKHLEASRRYVMARFPFVDGPARQAAYEKSLTAFDRWRAGRSIHRLDLDVGGRRVLCWQTGLSATAPKPLLIISGGFLSLKEQWAPVLPIFARLGLAVIATEMPGVGQNEVHYDADSWTYISGLLDAVADRAQVSQTYALMLSFSGHLALRCAVDDPRIRGVLTVGAPIAEFFTDPDWQQTLPAVTVDTLEHLAGSDLAEMRERALTVEDLARLTIPVAYVASLRDEVIPAADVRLLREHVSDLRILTHDDVHASPSHVVETQRWLALSLMQMLGVRDMRRVTIALMWNLARLRKRFSRTPGATPSSLFRSRTTV
jgi:esterase FrsA